MKNQKLVIKINKPVHEVFSFLLNPNNTPLWIDSFIKEETNETPVKVGTIYKNLNKQSFSSNKSGEWNEYKVISLDQDKQFEFLKSDNNYHVRYSFKDLGSNTTELEYYEWVENGELEDPFTQEILEKLKTVLEA